MKIVVLCTCMRAFAHNMKKQNAYLCTNVNEQPQISMLTHLYNKLTSHYVPCKYVSLVFFLIDRSSLRITEILRQFKRNLTISKSLRLGTSETHLQAQYRSRMHRLQRRPSARPIQQHLYLYTSKNRICHFFPAQCMKVQFRGPCWPCAGPWSSEANSRLAMAGEEGNSSTILNVRFIRGIYLTS